MFGTYSTEDLQISGSPFLCSKRSKGSKRITKLTTVWATLRSLQIFIFHLHFIQEERRRRGWQRMRWLDGIVNSMDMNLANFGRQWKTGKPGVHGVQRDECDLPTEQQQEMVEDEMLQSGVNTYFSIKGQRVTNFAFKGHMISVITAQSCHCSVQAATISM